MTAPRTPGPWHYLDTGEVVSSDPVTGLPDSDDVICAVAGEGPVANGCLIAAAPDHAFIGWAMCVQDATWEEWGDGKGEFCFAGLRHATTLDEFGCPVLTDHLRALIAKARGETPCR